MKAIIAKAKVQPGKEAQFEQEALALARQVDANEPGNRLYKLCKTNEGEYFFIELYDNDEAIAAHGQAPHFKEAGRKLFASMQSKPEITVLHVLGE
jgi:quinol monooxygenase YgiN